MKHDVSSDPRFERNARFGLAMLFVVALFNYIDRSIISILQEPLKADLHLSDTQLGALTGLSFALLYTTLALPIARLADRVNRKRLIAAALAIWSTATGCCGLANSFGVLVLFRMGVAFGEAGVVPASHSMISDYFPPRKRGTALALWGLSNPFGTMLGFAAGGWITAAMSWRQAFLVFGVLGVALAPVVLLMKEPRRGGTDPVQPLGEAEGPLPFGEVVARLWRLRAFRFLALGGAAHAFVQFLTINWNAPFYARVHHMPIREVAAYLALAVGLCGGLGQFFGGYMTDRLGRRDKRWYMWLPALASVLIVPAGLAQYFAPSAGAAMVLGLIPALLMNIWFAPIVATAQLLVSPRMRAFTSATLVLITNILGMGLGPLGTGAMSDRLTPIYGVDGLRYAMASMLVMDVVAAACFFRSAHHLRRELPTPT